ncbi:MAG: AAA family ATPase [Candidatus Heimdallarchaeota archaeon]|nr:AAA family ATPase [Candidatus Heimdallarchaeota archaeon]
MKNELFVVDRFGHAKSFIVNNPWYQFLQYLDKYSQVFISSETNIIGKQDYLVLEPSYLVSVTATVEAISCPRRIYIKNQGAEERLSREIVKKMTFGNLLHGVLSHRISFKTDVDEAIDSVVEKSKVQLLTSNIMEKEAYLYLQNNSQIINSLNIEGETELDSQNWQYGLSGKFDAITNNRIIEFKSSKIPDLHPWPDHNLQMITYLQMMEDIQTYTGTVLYINEGQMGMKKPTEWPIEETIRARNYAYLVYQGKLIPPVLRDEKKKICNNCFVKTGCYTLCAGLETQRDCEDCYHNSPCDKQGWNKRYQQFMKDLNEALYHEEKDNYFEQFGVSQVGVNQEIRERLASKGHVIIVENKKSQDIRNGNFITVFDISSSHNRFRNGDFTRVYPIDKDGKGSHIVTTFYSTIIVSINSATITLESANPLPQSIVLVPTNLSTQLRSSRRAIFSFINQPSPLINIITQKQNIGLEELSTISPKFINPLMDYNESQNNAIRLGLITPDIGIIQGPAGTGKTSVIVELIHQLYQMGKRVLCAAFTNMAVDNVAEKLSESKVPFLRLGNQYSISPNIRDFGILSRPDDFSSFIDNQLSYPILSTTSTIAKKDYEHVSFDYAILDEAAQMTEPESLKGIIKARIVILVGDHAQLQPIVKSEKAKELSLHISLFEKLAKSLPNRFVRLIEQYRMNDEILHFPNITFYDGELKSANSTIGTSKYNNFKGEILNDQPYQVVTLDQTPNVGWNQQNINEAKITVKIIHEIISSEKVEIHDIGVITPFRAQVALLRNLLPGLDIDTIDRFQGSERKIIIFSTVTMRDIPILTDPRRLNVALTRAKKKLIILLTNPENQGNAFLLESLLDNAKSRALVSNLNSDRISEYDILVLSDQVSEHFNVSSKKDMNLLRLIDEKSSIDSSQISGIYYNSIMLIVEEVNHGLCQICKQDINEGVQCPGCLYWYHIDHLSSWVITQLNCPICKHTLQLVQ